MAAVPRIADYDIVIEHLFSKLTTTHGAQSVYRFTKDDLVHAMEELKSLGRVRHIKNIPDIKYTYDARRDFPPGMAKYGFWGIVGEGKAKYRLEKISVNNLIRYPQDLSAFIGAPVSLVDKTPKQVAAVLGADEQATMTRLRYNDVISHFLGLSTYQVQGHERTSVSCGQIEVDEVYVGEDGNKKFVIPISAKGGDKDCLSYTQALNLSIYASEKQRFAGYEPVPLGVLRTVFGEVVIVQFTHASKLAGISISRVGLYQFR